MGQVVSLKRVHHGFYLRNALSYVWRLGVQTDLKGLGTFSLTEPIACCLRGGSGEHHGTLVLLRPGLLI